MGRIVTQLSFNTTYKYDPAKTGITIPLELLAYGRSIGVEAKLDTGSQFCIFEPAYAASLEIDVRTGREIRMLTASGMFPAFGHWVELQFLHYRFEVEVFFASERIGRNFVGQTGWLDRLRIGIVHHDNLLYVARYDE